MAELEPGREQLEMVGFYLHSKAPSTLIKRSGSILKLRGRVGLSIKPEGFSEQLVYDYLKQTRAMGARATTSSDGGPGLCEVHLQCPDPGSGAV